MLSAPGELGYGSAGYEPGRFIYGFLLLVCYPSRKSGTLDREAEVAESVPSPSIALKSHWNQ